MLDFLIKYGLVVNELSRLLDMRFIDGSAYSKSPVGKTLKQVLRYHNKAEQENRDYEMAKIEMLVKHLHEIEQYDLSLLVLFRESMKKSVTFDQYFGTRFEVNVAASLIRRKVKFTKTESPDFIISEADKIVKLECGSIHVSKLSDKDWTYKMRRVIKKKSKKDYCDSATALFVDITNVFYYMAKNGNQMELQAIKKYAMSSLKDTNYGNVTLFMYVINKELNRYESNYVRVDNTVVDMALQDFLSKYYPVGLHRVGAPAFVPWG